MHFDALCLACMVDELSTSLCPGRVQQVIQTGARSVGLEVYGHGARHSLVLDAAIDYPAVYVTNGKLRRGSEGDSPLGLLLRKYVRDAGLLSVRQPIEGERLLELEFANKEHGPTVLVVELIGRAANLILRRTNGMILDCLVRVPANETGRRVVMPGRVYSPPQAQAKLAPLDDGSPEYYARLAGILDADGPLWRALVAGVAGVSPPQAREMAWRIAGDENAPAREAALAALVEALQALWLPTRTGHWQPGCLAGNDRPAAYAPYVMHAPGVWQPQPTLSAAIAAVVAARRAAAQLPAPAHAPLVRDEYTVQRADVANTLHSARKRVNGQLTALAGDDPDPREAAALRHQAGWLLALQARIAPGQELLTVDAAATGGAPLTIPLDPTRTPVQQAEALYKRAGKLERAAIFVPTRRAHLQNDLDYLAQMEADLSQAHSRPEIDAVRQAIFDAGLLPPPRTARVRPVQPAGPRRYQIDGCTILVGRNAQQNDKLTFTLAKPDDYWLHARGAPGSHVVLHCPQGEPSVRALEAAAQLAAHFSSIGGELAADVIVSQRRHLARPQDGRPGQVLVRQEKVLRVPSRLPDDVTELTGSTS